MYYPQEIIDQVIDSVNIVEIISEYVKLTKKGSTYFGLCPFHNEKTPSFSVSDNPDRKIFYCFGCHTGGNVITFLMKYENYTYQEAIKVLAERAGIKLPEPTYSREDSEKYKLREQVLAINKETAIYYYHLIRSERGALAYKYLRDRELSDDTIKNYGLGYSDKYRDDLYRYIRSRGFNDEAMKATGLFSIKEKSVNDYFFNRVMFPIMDRRNKVIAFGGRVMGAGEPKYLNSPETVVFEKRKTLFGLNVAKKHRGAQFILCEGYMDVISLHQAGFTNAVASLGTSLTQGHAGVLKKYTSDVILSYDSDSPGKNAAVRAISILKDYNINVKVADLSPYKDPDELIKAMGHEEYRKRLQNARNGVMFEIDMTAGGMDLRDPDALTSFYNAAAKRLSVIDDEIERENYIRTVCREYRLEYDLLRSRTLRYALNAQNVRPVRRYEDLSGEHYGKDREKNTALDKSQTIVLKLVANDPFFYRKIEKIISEDDFIKKPYSGIARLLFDQAGKGKVNISGIIGSFEDASEQEKAAQILSSEDLDVSDDEFRQLVNDCVINIRKNSLEHEISEETDISRVISLRKEQEKLKSLDVFS